MKPKLTIIIPCYNCERTLREAVDSCFTQGFQSNEFEIVMVDDASTDNTRDLILQIESEHANIRHVFHEINSGGGSARNTAVAHAKSDIIFCLDSDDLLPPDTLKKMHAYLLSKQCDGVAIHSSIKFNGTDINDVSHVDTLPYAGEIIPFESVLEREGICPLYVVFMYTKHAFDKAGGYPTNHGFDTPGFGWRFLAAGLVAYTCPDAAYLHRVNFNKSYYLREYYDGKINFAWREIMLEHLYLFSDSAKSFITSFDCSDFTRNIFNELAAKDSIFIPDYEKEIGRERARERHRARAGKPIGRNSIRGIYMRLKALPQNSASDIFRKINARIKLLFRIKVKKAVKWSKIRKQ